MRNVIVLVAVVLLAGLVGWTVMRFTGASDDSMDDAEVQTALRGLTDALRLDERIEWQVMPDMVPAAARFPNTATYRRTVQFWRPAFVPPRAKR
jgi:hypothetical protein